MKATLLLFLCFLGSASFAQKEWSVFGKITNNNSKRALSGITVTNQRSKKVVVTNEKGDFYTRAAYGDSLILSGIGFGRRSILWKEGMEDLKVELEQQAIALEEVVVTERKSETLQKEIKDFLENTPNAASMKKDIQGNIISTNGLSDGRGGMGISIDALYELWSKDGKNRRKVAEWEYQDLKKFYVSLRYNEAVVKNLTKLSDEDAKDFMTYCTFTDDFILRATDYDLTYEIYKCLQNYHGSYFPRYRK